MPIGQRIKALRIKQGVSIDELACKLGKNRTTIYRYENGDIENLPLGILDCLADTLGTTPAYLMGWTDNNDSPDINDDLNIKMKHVEIWYNEFRDEVFSEEEYGKIFEYTRFLISLRDK